MPRPLVTIYSKPGCHLCDEAKARVDGLRRRLAFDVETVDITADPGKESVWREKIPAVFVDGEEAALYRVSPKRLTRILLDHGARPRWWVRMLRAGRPDHTG